MLAYLALCELEAARADAAETLARSALELLEEHRISDSHTGSSNPRIALGAALIAQGRLREAGAELERVLPRSPPQRRPAAGMRMRCSASQSRATDLLDVEGARGSGCGASRASTSTGCAAARPRSARESASAHVLAVTRRLAKS